MAAPIDTLSEKGGITKTTTRQSVAASLGLGRVSAEPGATKKGDIAEGLYREIEDFTPEELEEEQARVRKLIDWRIMPIVSCDSCNARLALIVSRFASPMLYNFSTSYLSTTLRHMI